MDLRLARLVDAFSARRQRIEVDVAALVEAEFARFDGWYSPRQVESVVATVSARVAAGQRSTAALTEAYVARVVGYETNRAVVGAVVPSVMGRTLRAGVADHEEVYARVASEYRYQRSLGIGSNEALSTSLGRARSLVSTDMGLAHQRQAQASLERRQITRYRRVVRPELSRNGSCGLCVAASDRLYNTRDLMPIHARCKCTVMAVTANTDPGSQLNDDTLSELYGDAGSTAAADLKRTRVVVEQHGELGPQLRVVGHHFRDPSEVAA